MLLTVNFFVVSFFYPFSSFCFFIWSFKTSSLRCLSGNLCLVITQLWLHSGGLEQILFNLMIWLCGILIFRALACFDLACMYAYWSKDLHYQAPWMFLLQSLQTRKCICFGEYFLVLIQMPLARTSCLSSISWIFKYSWYGRKTRGPS